MAEHEAIDVIADQVEKIACRKCGRHLDVSKLPMFSKVECPDCKTQQTVPARLGQFLLLEILGAGGMGAVYQALDQSLGRYVAIKVMRRAMGEDPAFVENFMREARAAAALNHRNVVQIYSCGQEKGQPYIVMELVSGGRLDEMIAQGNPIEEVRALEIGIDVTEGLKAANDVGLIHGDVKPANILFDKNGIAKVADFGLARFVAWQQDRGEVWGTPYYIAPEKARGQKVDHRSDIYSLGATLYHALGAKPPFDGKTATDVVLARLKNPAIGLRVIRPSLQPETADVIARTLESDPFMRYPTYSSLLADLREALRVAKQEQRSVHTKVKKSPTGPVVAIVLMLLAALAIVIGSLQWTSGRKEKAKEKAGETVAPAVTNAQETAQVTTGEQENVQAQAQKVAAIVQPFTPAHEQALNEAVAQLVRGNPTAMRDQLQDLYDKSSAIGMGRFWIRLFQAVACWAGQRDQDAVIYLQEVRNALFESPDPSRPHPGNMPQTLAKLMLKQVDEGAVSFEAARRPPWYGDFAEFYLGLDFLREGNVKRAKDFFSSYLSKQGKDPTWPYSFQPIAKMCVEQIDEFAQVQDKAAQLIANKQAAKARALLEEFRFKSSALMFPLAELALTRVKAAESKELEEQRRADRIAHRELVQVDLDRIEEVRTANLPFVAQKDFRKASAALSKVLSELKTSEGQQTYMGLREMYDRMDGLKRFLITRISASPYRGGARTELGGDAVGADLNGIRVALGSHGEMVLPWPEISPRLLAQLFGYYVTDTSLSDADRADENLSMAVFCYETTAFRAAAQYAEQAVKLDPAIKVKVRRLMPSLLPD